MKKESSLPLISMIGIFILGNAVINLPFSTHGSNTIYGFILSLIISLLLFLLFDRIKTRITLKTDSTFFKFFLIFYSVYCLFSGIICMRNFITFSDKVILPETNSFFPIIIYLILIYLLCRGNKKVILKLSFICGFVILLIMLFLLIVSFKNMNFEYIITKNKTDLKGVFYEGLSYICLAFAPSVVLLGFISEHNTNYSEKIFTKGFYFGSILLIISFLQSLLIMGNDFMSALMHPYASSISIITLGNNYSRLEGFSYFIYFAASLIKTTISVYVAKTSFIGVFKSFEKYFLYVALLIYGIISLFVTSFKNIEFIKIAPYILLPLLIIVPVFLIRAKNFKEQ